MTEPLTYPYRITLRRLSVAPEGLTADDVSAEICAVLVERGYAEQVSGQARWIITTAGLEALGA